MNRADHADIRIGTLAQLSAGPEYIRAMAVHGFESFQLTGWNGLPDGMDLAAVAPAFLDAAGAATISGLAPFGNPLVNEDHRLAFETAIRNVRRFGGDLVCGFTGAQEDRSVDENMPRFKEVWSELARVAEGEGVRIGWENCDMGGTWNRPQYNLAHSPRAWDFLFDALGDPAHVGLEWEPCHQMVSLADPIPGLKKYLHKVVHVHGKDATIDREVIRDYGIRGGVPFAYHRHPGFGETDWTLVISILRMAGFRGAIDIEGFHDPVYKDELETTGQVRALEYLKACRGGPYLANP